MAETDILNPLDWREQGLGFNPNPSYGFSRKMSANREMQKPRLGAPYSRDTANGGHILTMQWIGVPYEIARRVRNFYHDFKDGYFTYIDVDGGGRHYVGRFTSEPEEPHTANGKWSIQGVTFEEIPQARMLEYPADFDNDSHPLYVLDDALNPRVACMQGTWTQRIRPSAAGASVNDPSAYALYNDFPAAGDWAQVEYVGWGFQQVFDLSANGGLVHLLLDGTQIVTGLNLATGAAAASALGVSVVPNSPQLPTLVAVTFTDVPLDAHRLKVYSASAGSTTQPPGSPPPTTGIPTTTSISISNGTPSPGDTVTLTVDVFPSAATGNISFMDGIAFIGTTPLNNGEAVFVTPALSAGQHIFSASYPGDGTYAPSSSTTQVVAQTVGAAATLKGGIVFPPLRYIY